MKNPDKEARKAALKEAGAAQHKVGMWLLGCGMLIVLLFVLAIRGAPVEPALVTMFGICGCMGVAIVQAIRNIRERRVFLSPQLKERKQRKAEQKAEAEKRRMAYQIQRQEIQRGRTTIVEAALVSIASRKKVGSLAGRMLVGSLFGEIGAVAGGMSAKSRETATFYVTYKDGRTKTETVNVGSARFRELMGYVV